jgi:glycosyltransferase involved in cell wall biosynthesis
MIALETPTQDPSLLAAPDSAARFAGSRSTSKSLPMVLHTRVVTGHGGGPEKTILNSPRFLSGLGYQAKLAYLHPPADPGFEALQVRGAALGADVLSVPDRGPLDLTVVSKLVRICRREKVAIWHAHDYKSNVLGLLVRWFWPMKLVTTLHGWTNLTGRAPFYVKLDKRALPYYQAAICVSDDLLLECNALGLAAERCHLIHNAIDTDDYRRTISNEEAKRALGCDPADVLVGSVGRLSPEKAFDQLIQAIVDLRRTGKRVSLWIAGEGDARSALQNVIDRLQCGSYVRLLGHVADPKTLYQAMDVFALSSIREGLPNVVLEAMALETPVVATRIAGMPTLIRDGLDGVLVEPGNLKELKSAVGRLIDDAALRRRLAVAARTTIETRFSFTHRMEKVAGVYDALLNRDTSSCRR